MEYRGPLLPMAFSPWLLPNQLIQHPARNEYPTSHSHVVDCSTTTLLTNQPGTDAQYLGASRTEYDPLSGVDMSSLLSSPPAFPVQVQPERQG